MAHELLDRDSFRKGVFIRDGHKCVICGAKGYWHWPDASTMQKDCGLAGVPLDAHHIIERRLWDDGGYYLDNGATLCDDHFGDDGNITGCHKKAEQTILTCDEIREAAGIKRILLPEHLYRDAVYDKWGNIINPDGTRTPGELFGDESVRKVLMPLIAIDVFRKHIKYPRTYHLPWSPGKTDDDRTLEDVSVFNGRRVIVTEKLDGENTTMYNDYIHARSLDSGGHPSRQWVKNYHAQIQYNIPEGWRFCGENLFAKHTLAYDNLPSFFMLFSIWNESNICLSWDETVEYAAILDIKTVPVLYDGIWDEALVKGIGSKMDLNKQEGYVVRLADSFGYGAFRKSIAKYVRAAHVGTGHHWMAQAVIKNEMAK